MPEATGYQLFVGLAKLHEGDFRLPVMMEGRDGYEEFSGEIVVVPAQQKMSGPIPAYILLKKVTD
jgi:hypothetical protein